LRTVTPYNTDDTKKEQVAKMFDNIAWRYDLLNSLLSLGIHKNWRNKCVKILKVKNPKTILDVATGTAEFALACAKLKPEKITGIDISEGMMQIGRKKIEKYNLQNLIELQYGDAESADFPNDSFDSIVVGFGVRNFENLDKGLQNLYRILKPGGTLVILEFANPENKLVKWVYNFYFGKVTPFIGKLLSGDGRAYSYLPESVKAFPYNHKMVEVLRSNQYIDPQYMKLSMGIASIYIATK